jgi:hypothetical protein
MILRSEILWKRQPGCWDGDLIDKLADTSSAALRGESWFPQPLMKHDSLFGRLFECHAAESTGLH